MSGEPRSREALARALDAEPDGWLRRAACAGADPTIFFPGRGESTAEALTYCERCPVRAPCLARGQALSSRCGIWGGTSERERRRMRGSR